MNAHERFRWTPEMAERLLDGRPVPGRQAQRLARQLALTTAAAFPGELAGEDAAAEAFMTAVSGDVAPPSRRDTMSKSAVLAKLLTLKAAAVAVAALSAGGVALAATTSVLPNPLGPGHSAHSTAAPDHSDGQHGNGEATPSPSLVGLCTAFLAGAGSDHGKALDSPAFTALITAAGGKDNVDAFCAKLGVSAPGAGRGTDNPGPTGHPTGDPSAHPGPTDHPTGEPTHPAGSPSTHPSA